MSDKSRRSAGQHGRALLELGIVSVLGIVATAGFQLVAINGLTPDDFGLLASFLALINVVAVGSAALRNSVAVATAESITASGSPRGRLDGTLVEALALGVAAALLLVLIAPWLAPFLGADVRALLFTALAALPYFLFARAQGLLQGAGRTRAVVWWTTGSQLVLLALTAIVVGLAFGSAGILIAVVFVTVAFTIGSSVQAYRVAPRPRSHPFSLDTAVVLLLTIGFAWLTNADVILVRSVADESVAGAYAAAGVLAKAVLIVPATLGLYLLPRFVGRRQDVAMTRLGVNVVLAVTVLAGLVMFLGFLLVGEPLIAVLFPHGYELAGSLIPWLALMLLPWAAAQGVLIRVTAARSKLGVLLFALAVVAQWVAGLLVLPDVYAFMLANGLVGLGVLIALFLIHMLVARTVGQPEGSSEPPMPIAGDIDG